MRRRGLYPINKIKWHFFIYIRADKCNPCIDAKLNLSRSSSSPIVVQEWKKKRKRTRWHRFDSSLVSSKRDCIKVMKMKSNGARKTLRFLFQAFLLKKKEGKREKIKEIRMTAKARKKEWNWILAECGDSRINLNSEWSPIPKIVSRTFQPRISYAYVQHSSRYFRISPSKKRYLLGEILRCRNSSISPSFFSFFFF